MSMRLLYGEYICGDKGDRYEGVFKVKFAPLLLQPNLNCCALSSLMFMEYWDGKIPRNIADEMQSLDIMNGMRRVILQDILFSERNERIGFVKEFLEKLKTKLKKKSSSSATQVQTSVALPTAVSEQPSTPATSTQQKKSTQRGRTRAQTAALLPTAAAGHQKKESRASTDYLDRLYRRRQAAKKTKK